MQNRPKTITKLLTCLLGTLMAIVFTACSEQKNEVFAKFNQTYPAETGGTLIDAMSGEPSGLIAMIAGESSASQIASNIFNSLLKYDKNLELTGELAKSWDISADQKTITFHLKPDLKWADGKPLTSEDVLFTWQLVTDDNTHTPYGADYKLVKKAETACIQTALS